MNSTEAQEPVTLRLLIVWEKQFHIMFRPCMASCSVFVCWKVPKSTHLPSQCRLHHCSVSGEHCGGDACTAHLARPCLLAPVSLSPREDSSQVFGDSEALEEHSREYFHLCAVLMGREDHRTGRLVNWNVFGQLFQVAHGHFSHSTHTL